MGPITRCRGSRTIRIRWSGSTRRVPCRHDFPTDEYLVAPQTQTGVPEFADSYDQLDAGVQFSVTPNVILTADAINLTDSYEFHYANVIQNTQEYRTVGRRYSVGVRVKF